MLRPLSVLLLALVTATITACGNSVPLAPGLAAQSGPTAISEKEVERWMVAFAQTPGQPFRRIPDAPSFTGCAQGIAQSQGAPKSLAARKQACKKGYETLQDEALVWLLNQAELTRQAKRRGIYQRISQDSRRKLSRLAKNKNFAKELKLAGLTEEMAYQRIFTNRVGKAITNEARRSAPRPSEGEIKAYLIKEKLPANSKNEKRAAKELYQFNQEKAVRGQFRQITKELTSRTTCRQEYKVRFCGRVVQ